MSSVSSALVALIVSRCPRGARWRTVVALGLLTAALGSCTPTPPAPPAPSVEAPAAVAPEPPAQSAAARALILRAEAQIANHHLTTPAGDNALESLQQALALEPNQPDTIEAVFRGRERIAESYLALADQALQRRERTQAERLLALATEVDPEHLGIPPMRVRLELAARARLRSMTLDRKALDARSPSLRTRLASLGAELRRGEGFVLIRARNDAEGRWLYEQLANIAGRAHGAARLRAEIRRAATASLEITTYERAASRSTP